MFRHPCIILSGWIAHNIIVDDPILFIGQRRAWNVTFSITYWDSGLGVLSLSIWPTSSYWSNSQATGLKRYLAEFRFNSTFPSRGFPCNSFRSGNLKWKIKQPESGAGLRQSRSSVRPSFEDYSWIEFHPQIRRERFRQWGHKNLNKAQITRLRRAISPKQRLHKNVPSSNILVHSEAF